jgi:hypothetical protein
VSVDMATARAIRLPRWASILALTSLVVLASFGLRWCVSMVGQAMPMHCHGCTANMDATEHMAWWQSQLQSVPATHGSFVLLALLVLAIVAVAPVVAVAPAFAPFQFSRQRFRPPGASYLAALLADGILNPKIYS